MRIPRCFIDQPLAAGSLVTAPETVATHLLRVLRMGTGDACLLFNGDGNDHAATIRQADKRGCVLQVGEAEAVDRESPLRIHLLQGVARGEKMDLILQKACELGVTAIHPVSTERSEVRLDGERAARRREHWLGVLRAACEQNGRSRVPALSAIRPLDSALAELGDVQGLMLSPQGPSPLARTDIDPRRDIALLVGPEGGLGERDIRAASAAGFAACRLGPRILRTETAGLTALAVLQTRWGDLG